MMEIGKRVHFSNLVLPEVTDQVTNQSPAQQQGKPYIHCFKDTTTSPGASGVHYQGNCSPAHLPKPPAKHL